MTLHHQFDFYIFFKHVLNCIVVLFYKFSLCCLLLPCHNKGLLPSKVLCNMRHTSKVFGVQSFPQEILTAYITKSPANLSIAQEKDQKGLNDNIQNYKRGGRSEYSVSHRVWAQISILTKALLMTSFFSKRLSGGAYTGSYCQCLMHNTNNQLGKCIFYFLRVQN